MPAEALLLGEVIRGTEANDLALADGESAVGRERRIPRSPPDRAKRCRRRLVAVEEEQLAVPQDHGNPPSAETATFTAKRSGFAFRNVSSLPDSGR